MSENLHGIDDLFKSAFEKVDDMPGEAVWKNIDQQLDKRKVTFLLKRSRTWRWVAAACLIFSFGMAMYVVQSKIAGPSVAKKMQSPAKTSHTINSTPGVKDGSRPLDETPNNNPAIDSENTSLSSTPHQPYKEDSVIADNAYKDTHASKLNNNNKVFKAEKNISSSVKSQHKKAMKAGMVNDKLANNRIGIAPEQKLESLKTRTAMNNEIAANKSNYKKLEKKIMNGYNASIAKPIKKADDDFKRTYDMNAAIASDKQLNIGLQDAASLSFPAKPNSGLPYYDAALAKQSRKFSPALTASVFYSPDFSSNHTKPDKPRFREDEKNEIKRNEENKSSSTTGLLLQYGLTKHLSIESGITLSKITTGFKPKTIFARPDDNGKVTFRFTCAAGTSNVSVKSAAHPLPGDSIRVSNSSNKLEYIGIPINLRYTFKYGKFAFQPGVGLSAFFLTNSNIETNIATNNGYEKAITRGIKGLKKNYINGLLSLKASYGISKNVSLDFMPQARFGLSPINKKSPVKTNYHSLGLGMGLSFKFL